MKRCIICDELKEFREFHKALDKPDGHRNDCKLCRKTKKQKDNHVKRCATCNVVKPNTKEYFYLHLSTGITRSVCIPCYNVKSKANHLITRYNLSLSDYKLKLIEQDNKCVICGLASYRLVVDHNHTTGQIRSLLCDGCNTGLGSFKENKEFLMNAIKYIDHHSEQTN